MTTTSQHTVESLQKLNERLAVIDNAQRNIADLASQMTSLQSVLANKQQRGAFGQGRMEIDRPGRPAQGLLRIPVHAVEQDAVPIVRCSFPDRRPLAIDAKFPLEAVTALREAKTEEERKQAAARMRQDVSKARRRHRRQISDPGRDPGLGADVRALRIRLRRIA